MGEDRVMGREKIRRERARRVKALEKRWTVERWDEFVEKGRAVAKEEARRRRRKAETLAEAVKRDGRKRGRPLVRGAPGRP